MKINKSKVTDMTEGNILRHLIMFAVPLLIGNIFQQVYTIVDTMVAGYNLGDLAIAAIGATSVLYYLILNFALGLNNGAAIVVTQAFGAGDRSQLKKSIAGMIEINLVVGIALSILAVTFTKPLMVLMNVPDSIFDMTYSYIVIIFGGMLATVLYNMFSAILRSFGNSRAPLVFLIIATVVNIILDLLFIVKMGMGVEGTAMATVIAQGLSALLAGIYTFRGYREYMPAGADYRVPMSLLQNLLSTGFAMALMYCVVELGSVIFQSATNSLGDNYISAYTAARRWIEMLMQPLASIGDASSTFIGQNYGAGHKSRIREGILRACQLMVAVSLVFWVLTYLFAPYMIRFITGTSSAEIIRNGVLSLHIHIPFYSALGILFILRNAMQSTGQKLVPVISSCLELSMKILSAFILIPRFGFIATCWTEPSTWCIMMVYLVIMFMIMRKQDKI